MLENANLALAGVHHRSVGAEEQQQQKAAEGVLVEMHILSILQVDSFQGQHHLKHA